MSKAIVFSLPGNNQLAQALANRLGLELGILEIRDFPDGESFIRIASEVNHKYAVIVCTLDHPNPKLIPLMFTAQTLRELGVEKVILVAPYLAYMRQDKRFHPGEVISSALFAKCLSGWIDELITVDPHLHRIKQLADIYSLATIATLHAAKTIAEWIRLNIDLPVLIGPDEESRQWVADIAGYANLPYLIGQKNRLGDRQVITSLPDSKHTDHVPVLVDDIISSGSSMIAAIELLSAHGWHKKPICIGVHALFDREIEQRLMQAGAEDVVTCNTVPHVTNRIDLTAVIAETLADLCLKDD